MGSLLRVNYNLIQIIKWMPPYWDNKALPTPTLTLPDTFIFYFLIISFISIENKCLSDAMWDLKRNKKKFGKRRARTRVDRVKKHAPYHLRHWNWCWIGVFFLCWLNQSHVSGRG